MKILRLPDVLAIIGVSRSKLYADIKAGDFPQPIRLGARAVGWIDTGIYEWIDVRARMTNTAGTIARPQESA